MDIFVEQIVVVKKGMRERVLTGLIVVAGLAMLALTLLTFYTFFPLVAIGVGLGAWYLLRELYREFEYSVTNGTVDIDVIIGKRRRSRVVSVAGGKIERFEPFSADIDGQEYGRRVYAWASPADAGAAWAFTYRSKKSGHTLVVFTPDERVLEAARAGLSPLVRREIEARSQKPEAR